LSRLPLARDGVDDDGGEDDFEITPLWRGEKDQSKPPRRRSWWWRLSVSRNALFSQEDRFLGYIRRYMKGGDEDDV
jgi:hypothetical protein